jgi:hypothetical protein
MKVKKIFEEKKQKEEKTALPPNTSTDGFEVSNQMTQDQSSKSISLAALELE